MQAKSRPDPRVWLRRIASVAFWLLAVEPRTKSPHTIRYRTAYAVRWSLPRAARFHAAPRPDGDRDNSPAARLARYWWAVPFY